MDSDAPATAAVAPGATYRLQLHAGFGFTDAAAAVPYLAELGVTHVYCSPILQAAPGSMHGYDVVDHARLSDELGGDSGWAELAASCRANDMKIIVDVVPNHAAVPTPESLNPALWLMLRDGPGSPAARWFDVDWDALGGRILLPILGKPLDDAIRDGEVTIDTAAGVCRYFDHEFPLRAGSVSDDVRTTLLAQHWELAFWREANRRLNYRRFFDITTLIGLRVEDGEVFAATHRRLLELFDAGDIDGFRIDHPDGLADPGGYLARLADRTGDAWTVVEKILEPGESLPSDWRCAGTTGYDAIAAITNAFIDPAGLDELDGIWRSLADPDCHDWPNVVDQSKRQALSGAFVPEVRRLVRELRPLVPSLEDAVLTAVIEELLVAFDVYRAYRSSATRIDEAAKHASEARPELHAAIDAVAQILRRGTTHNGTAAETAAATRFSQTTGPVMAKGVEDTAIYRFHRLTALNEVGGDPASRGGDGSLVEFCRQIAATWPATMTALSTHDTKRSEDVRARLLTLAEIPSAWATAVGEWDSLVGADDIGVDAQTRYLTWQTLVGAWPLSQDRLSAYLLKATREAKLHTSWTDPDESYEKAVENFIEAIFGDPDLPNQIDEWCRDNIDVAARSVALGQKLVQLTMPGVPDVYQGTELTDLSLVDPDNRRPVDFDTRLNLLRQLPRTPSLAEDHLGVTKLLVCSRALRLRRERPESFASGDYRPLRADGAASRHLVGFARGDDVLVLATRWPVSLATAGGWRDTSIELPAGDWSDVITGQAATSGRLGDLAARLPVALLARNSG